MESISLLANSQDVDEKMLYLEATNEACDSRQNQSNARDRILQTLHVTYTVAITLALLLAVLYSTVATKVAASKHPFADISYVSTVWHPNLDFTDDEIFRGTMNGSLQGVGWDTLRLKNGYWLEMTTEFLSEPRNGLPPRFFNSSSLTTEAFVPSFHHQLHCLMQLKVIAMGMKEPIVSSSHASHCIELIRQALICSADMTLEVPTTVADEYWAGPSGWGQTHQCRDFDAVQKIVSERGIAQAALLASAPWLGSS